MQLRTIAAASRFRHQHQQRIFSFHPGSPWRGNTSVAAPAPGLGSVAQKPPPPMVVGRFLKEEEEAFLDEGGRGGGRSSATGRPFLSLSSAPAGGLRSAASSLPAPARPFTPVYTQPSIGDKDIARELRKSDSAVEVLRSFDENRRNYDIVNTATALSRVLALHTAVKPWKRPPLPKRELNVLVNHAIESLRGSLATFVAQAPGSPAGTPSSGSSPSAAASGPQLLPRTLASLMWGLCKLDRMPHVLLDECSVALRSRAGELTPVDIVQVTYAYSRANIPAPSLFNAIGREAARRVRSFSPSELSSLLLSFTSLGVAAPELFSAVAERLGSGAQGDARPVRSVRQRKAASRAQEEREGLSPQTTANLATAFARSLRLDALEVRANAGLGAAAAAAVAAPGAGKEGRTRVTPSSGTPHAVAAVRALGVLARRAADIARENRVPLPHSSPSGSPEGPSALTASGLAQVAWSLSTALTAAGVGLLEGPAAAALARAAVALAEEGVLRAAASGAVPGNQGAGAASFAGIVGGGATAVPFSFAPREFTALLEAGARGVPLPGASPSSHVTSPPPSAAGALAGTSSAPVPGGRPSPAVPTAPTISDTVVAGTLGELSKAVAHRQTRRTLAPSQLATLARAWADTRHQLQVRLANAVAVGEAAGLIGADAEGRTEGAGGGAPPAAYSEAAVPAPGAPASTPEVQAARLCATAAAAVQAAARAEVARVSGLIRGLGAPEVLGSIVAQAVALLEPPVPSAGAEGALAGGGQGAGGRSSLTPTSARPILVHPYPGAAAGSDAGAPLPLTPTSSPSSLAPYRPNLPQVPASPSSSAVVSAAAAASDPLDTALEAVEGASGHRGPRSALGDRAAQRALAAVARIEGRDELASDIKDALALAGAMRDSEWLSSGDGGAPDVRANARSYSQTQAEAEHVQEKLDSLRATSTASAQGDLSAPRPKYDPLGSQAASAASAPFHLKDAIEILDALAATGCVAQPTELFRRVAERVLEVEGEIAAAAAATALPGVAPAPLGHRGAGGVGDRDLFRRSLRDLSPRDTLRLLRSFYWCATARDAGAVMQAVGEAYCREQALFWNGLALELGAGGGGIGGRAAAWEAEGEEEEGEDSPWDSRRARSSNSSVAGSASSSQPSSLTKQRGAAPGKEAREEGTWPPAPAPGSPSPSDSVFERAATSLLLEEGARQEHYWDSPEPQPWGAGPMGKRTTGMQFLDAVSADAAASSAAAAAGESSPAPSGPFFDEEPTFAGFGASSRVHHPRLPPRLRLRGEQGAGGVPVTGGSGSPSSARGSGAGAGTSGFAVVDEASGAVEGVREAAGGGAQGHLGGLRVSDVLALQGREDEDGFDEEEDEGDGSGRRGRKGTGRGSAPPSPGSLPPSPSLTSPRGWAHRLLFKSRPADRAALCGLLALGLPPDAGLQPLAPGTPARGALDSLRVAVAQAGATAPLVTPPEWHLPGGPLWRRQQQQTQRNSGRWGLLQQQSAQASGSPLRLESGSSSNGAYRGLGEQRWQRGLPGVPVPGATSSGGVEGEGGAGSLPRPRLGVALHSLASSVVASQAQLGPGAALALLQIAATRGGPPTSAVAAASSALTGGELPPRVGPMTHLLWTVGRDRLTSAGPCRYRHGSLQAPGEPEPASPSIALALALGAVSDPSRGAPEGRSSRPNTSVRVQRGYAETRALGALQQFAEASAPSWMRSGRGRGASPEALASSLSAAAGSPGDPAAVASAVQALARVAGLTL